MNSEQKVIIKQDGSIKTKILGKYIQQGNNLVDTIFFGVEGLESTDGLVATANFMLPNDDFNSLTGKATSVEVDMEVYYGWLFTLTSNQTQYAGEVEMAIRITEGSKLTYSYNLPITINESVVDPTQQYITLAQYNSLVEALGQYQLQWSKSNALGIDGTDGYTQDIMDEGQIWIGYGKATGDRAYINYNEKAASHNAHIKELAFYDDLSAYLPLKGGTMSGAINMGQNAITELPSISTSSTNFKLLKTYTYNNVNRKSQLRIDGGSWGTELSLHNERATAENDHYVSLTLGADTSKDILKIKSKSELESTSRNIGQLNLTNGIIRLYKGLAVSGDDDEQGLMYDPDGTEEIYLNHGIWNTRVCVGRRYISIKEGVDGASADIKEYAKFDIENNELSMLGLIINQDDETIYFKVGEPNDFQQIAFIEKSEGNIEVMKDVVFDNNITASIISGWQVKADYVKDNDDTAVPNIKWVNDTLTTALTTIKKNSYQLVDTSVYTTLNAFLQSTGEEGYIYLYPVNLSDLTKGYYQYIWENSAWLSLGTTQIDLSNYELIYDYHNVRSYLGSSTPDTDELNKLSINQLFFTSDKSDHISFNYKFLQSGILYSNFVRTKELANREDLDAYLPLKGGTLSGALNVDGNNINNVRNITTSGDALNIKSTDSSQDFTIDIWNSGSSEISDIKLSKKKGNTLKQLILELANDNVSLDIQTTDSNKHTYYADVVDVADDGSVDFINGAKSSVVPQNNNDLTNKEYVDNKVGSLSVVDGQLCITYEN